MGKEIERKYLVKQEAWKPQAEGTHFKKGYLNAQKERVVRVRIEGAKAKLTIKGITTGAVSYTHLDVYKRQILPQVTFSIAVRMAVMSIVAGN